ncbi:MBL fold metallo-hydrolase [Nocardia sp. ET3-3]|uniref:MBL fold metallo-hydrolase n=1 Tax=Nocardia terrae TaxID=2675851 RepID=A0A7K1V3Y6_9NOCA|nr:MBL fold metallo-hydrolase [Nocardia terrae]MVU81324.1 MBL fold metallo-hydrolase [Nocardia terrae]
MTQAINPAALGRLNPIADGVHVFSQPDWGWGLNNCGVLVTDEAVLVIDTCFTERRTARLRQEIRRITDAPVRYLVNTHHHGDHTFGNYQFPDATIIGHRYCREKVLSENLAVVPYFDTVEWGDIRISPPTVCFDQQMSIALGNEQVQLISVAPAHTLGDVVVWLPRRRILFVGDVALNGATPVITDGSYVGTVRALETVRALDPQVVVPGHGPIGGPEIFDAVSRYFDFVYDAAQLGLSSGRTPLEAARAADLGEFAGWSDSERLVANIARVYSEARGYPVGTPLERKEIAPMMVEFAGHPLHCYA